MCCCYVPLPSHKYSTKCHENKYLTDWDSYLFQAAYGFGIDAAGVVFYSEIFPNHLRAKGVSLVIATFALTDLVYLQVTPTAFANIGWKFFLVRRRFHSSCLIGICIR